MSASLQAPRIDLHPTTMSPTQFEAAIEPMMQQLLAYFQRRVDPREDAADCLSDTLMVLWRNIATLPADADELRAYSYGVARNVLANQRRGRGRRTALAERLRGHLREHVNPHTDVEATDVLGQLNKQDRELVTLVALDGFSVQEAGAHLGLRPEAARARYSRARARLRKQLTP